MANTAEDKLTQAKGKAREMAGKATGNRKQEIKGKAENARGKITEGAKKFGDKLS
jgi:uncharacterized protein YjbJ (UPF0337 family)